MSSEQDAVERLDEIRERAEYLRDYGEKDLYHYDPQEHKDLLFLLDQLEASQQENERLRDAMKTLGGWPDYPPTKLPADEFANAVLAVLEEGTQDE